MTEADMMDVARDALVVMIKISAPVLLTSLAVGLLISLFQALTQIQEQTLSFVPKVILVFGVLLLTFPFMLHQLIDFMREMMDRAISGG